VRTDRQYAGTALHYWYNLASHQHDNSGRGGAMNIRGADSPARARAKQLRFDRYVLDLDRGYLLLDGSEIVLRPKTFAVLRHLVENSGRLVAKDELFAAVWPNIAITDDVLVQSVGELRRALGEDGTRLIRTVPRRGYRFESEVSFAALTDQSSDAALLSNASPTLRQPADGGTHELSISLTRNLAAPSRRLFAVLILVLVLAAGAVGIAIQWKFSTSPEIAAKPAIAVLPWVNQSGDSTRDYFSDGLTQDIISALGRFSALTVLSWNAVQPYKAKPASPEEIGRALAVSYLVEGSVRQTADRIRVTAQLVDARQGRVLWSAHFDEPLSDVFTLQDNISAQIVSAMALRVTQIEQRRVLAKPTESLEAYDYVLRARPASQHPTRANVAEARTLLKRAIDLDPNYAAAYAALAETYYIAPAMGWAESPAAFLSRGEELALKALSLDDADVHAHIVLSRIHIFHQRYKQAAAEIDRAIAINPNDAQGLGGRGDILMWLGETDAAIETLELAQRIDPDLNTIDRFALSLAYYLRRRYEAAIEQAELNLRQNANASFSRIVLAAAYAQQDRAEDSARVVEVIRRTDPTFDPKAFGTKFLNSVDLDHVRDGLRKAGLDTAETGVSPLRN
jgi:TolB-like protein/DNA-binding winged helix-turn-helix (wHTH) protein/cytochrome c-type biogenesis protein CcmH/NrfG